MAPPPDTHDAALMNTPSPWRRTTLGVMLVASIIIAGCTTQAPPATASPSAAPSDRPRPSETTSPSAAPSAPAAVSWEEANVPDAEMASSIITIVPGGDGLVAIGFDGAFGSLLWTSTDGRTWTDVTPQSFASVGIASVVEWRGGLIAVGRGNTLDVEAQLAAVYRSDDGVTWRQVPGGEEMLGQLIDVVATDDGLFAVGGVPGRDAAGIWRSADGETWERTGGDFEHAFMWSITEGGPGLAAVGWRRNPEPDLAVWTSTDGRDWTLAPDPEGFEGYEATDVTNLDGTLVAVGSPVAGGQGRIWVSDEGLAWHLADVSGMDGDAFARTVNRTLAGLVATGSAGDQHGAAWLSTDGRSWQPLGDPFPNAFFSGAFPTDDALLIAGATQAGTLETGIQARAMVYGASLSD